MNRENEYYCPNCGATLNNQANFKPNVEVWECNSCGQKLYRNDADAEQITWYCDDCHSELSLQEGFSDKLGSWVCKVCGYKNTISPEFIYDSVYDYEDHIVYDETKNMYLPKPKNKQDNQ